MEAQVEIFPGEAGFEMVTLSEPTIGPETGICYEAGRVYIDKRDYAGIIAGSAK